MNRALSTVVEKRKMELSVYNNGLYERSKQGLRVGRKTKSNREDGIESVMETEGNKSRRAF